jgi:hypothetical protein
MITVKIVAKTNLDVIDTIGRLFPDRVIKTVQITNGHDIDKWNVYEIQVTTIDENNETETTMAT